MGPFPTVDILLFFCSCNPPHIGHSEALQNALLHLPTLQKILVFPPAHHVWGKAMVAFPHRATMARLAFRPLDPRIEVSELETKEGLSGYSVDTIPLIQKVYPGRTLGMLVGADTLKVFPQRKDWQTVLSGVFLFVAPRGSVTQKEARENIPESLLPFVDRRLFFLPDSPNRLALDASSSSVRLEIPHQVPLEVVPQVAQYIKDNLLFGVI